MPPSRRRVSALHERVAQRAEHRCEYCRAPEIVFNAPFEIEHIFAKALGGSSDMENLALACRSCNVHKAAALICRDPESGLDVPLYNPGRQRWDEHFRFDVQTGHVVGIGPIGRATVSRLAMNSPSAVRARCLWFALGLY